MSFAEVEKSISNLGKKARDGKLSMDDMKGVLLLYLTEVSMDP